MARTLYGVLENTLAAIAAMRASSDVDSEIDRKLARFEAAIQQALASSRDGATVARADEYVALDALCELHLAVQARPEPLRTRLRPIVDEWIAYAADTGLTPQELTQPGQPDSKRDDDWLRLE